MTGTQTFIARCALGVFSSAATLLAVRWRWWYRLSAISFERNFLGAFAAVRVLLFALIFLVLRLPVRGDLPAYYVSQAAARLAGKMPYRDFDSSYAPLFSVMNAAVYAIHQSPLTLVAFAIAAEILAAFVWLRVFQGALREDVARAAVLFCLFNPFSLQFVVIDGQNNVFISLLLGLAVLFVLKQKWPLSGAMLGLSIAVVKFLPLLFTPAFAVHARRKWALWAAGCAAVVLPVYGIAAFGLHLNVLSSLSAEGARRSPSGLPYLFETISGIAVSSHVWDALMLLALACVCARTLWIATRGKQQTVAEQAVRTVATATLYMVTTMAMSKKTWPAYTVIILFPLAAVVMQAVIQRRRRFGRYAAVIFVVFAMVGVTEHSLWSSLLSQVDSVGLHALLAAGNGRAWVLLILELMLLGLYGWIASLLFAWEAEPMVENSSTYPA